MHGGGFFIYVFLVIAMISLLLDWYVFNGLKTLTSGWKSHRLRQLVNWGCILISVGVTVFFIAGVRSYKTAKGMTPFHEWMLSIFLTFFITKIFFVLVLFLSDIGRFFYGIINNIINPKSKTGESFFPARRKFISETAILVAAIPFAGLVLCYV